MVVTNSGCHDNRMDKIWWNEQWMGWPLGPHYAASSNVDNAHKLQGKALIIMGEMDSNVDPTSSLQVVDALVKANKHFDMLYIPGQNHGVGVLANQHYRDDYFVHHLLGVEPPDWNRVSLPAEPTTAEYTKPVRQRSSMPIDLKKVKSCKIHPAIGIARVGDHPTEFFIGPETPGLYTPPPTYKSGTPPAINGRARASASSLTMRRVNRLAS